MAPSEIDYYKILGLGRYATDDDIKKAFRKLARDTHPDKNPNDPTAKERFQDLQRAYDTLKDNLERSKYDEDNLLHGMPAGTHRTPAGKSGTAKRYATPASTTSHTPGWTNGTPRAYDGFAQASAKSRGWGSSYYDEWDPKPQRDPFGSHRQPKPPSSEYEDLYGSYKPRESAYARTSSTRPHPTSAKYPPTSGSTSSSSPRPKSTSGANPRPQPNATPGPGFNVADYIKEKARQEEQKAKEEERVVREAEELKRQEEERQRKREEKEKERRRAEAAARNPYTDTNGFGRSTPKPNGYAYSYTADTPSPYSSRKEDDELLREADEKLKERGKPPKHPYLSSGSRRTSRPSMRSKPEPPPPKWPKDHPIYESHAAPENWAHEKSHPEEIHVVEATPMDAEVPPSRDYFGKFAPHAGPELRKDVPGAYPASPPPPPPPPVFPFTSAATPTPAKPTPVNAQSAMPNYPTRSEVPTPTPMKQPRSSPLAGESRKPAAESRKPATESRKPAAESWKPAAESRKPAAETPKPAAEALKPPAETPKPPAETPKPAAETQKPVVESQRHAEETKEEPSESTEKSTPVFNVFAFQEKVTPSRHEKPFLAPFQFSFAGSGFVGSGTGTGTFTSNKSAEALGGKSASAGTAPHIRPQSQPPQMQSFYAPPPSAPPNLQQQKKAGESKLDDAFMRRELMENLMKQAFTFKPAASNSAASKRKKSAPTLGKKRSHVLHRASSKEPKVDSQPPPKTGSDTECDEPNPTATKSAPEPPVETSTTDKFGYEPMDAEPTGAPKTVPKPAPTPMPKAVPHKTSLPNGVRKPSAAARKPKIGLGLDMGGLGAVPPLSRSPADVGLGGFETLKESLPFPSQSSGKPPLGSRIPGLRMKSPSSTTSDPFGWSIPQDFWNMYPQTPMDEPFVVPKAPPAPKLPVQVSLDGYNRFYNSLGPYIEDWNRYEAKVHALRAELTSKSLHVSSTELLDTQDIVRYMERVKRRDTLLDQSFTKARDKHLTALDMWVKLRESVLKEVAHQELH